MNTAFFASVILTVILIAKLDETCTKPPEGLKKNLILGMMAVSLVSLITLCTWVGYFMQYDEVLFPPTPWAMILFVMATPVLTCLIGVYVYMAQGK